jgi:hypothetical protein
LPDQVGVFGANILHQRKHLLRRDHAQCLPALNLSHLPPEAVERHQLSQCLALLAPMLAP